MAAYSIRQDDADLIALTQRAEAGEEVVLSREGRPVAKIIAFDRRLGGLSDSLGLPRPFGLKLSGSGDVSPAFDEEMTDEELREWGML